MSLTITIDEDNLIEWDQMTDSADGSFINSATVDWELKEKDDTVLFSGTLAFVVASDGKYQGTMDKADTVNLERGEKYFLELTATFGGLDGFRRIMCIAQFHGEV
jgi:uncharacterized protein involved in high-affinity Fe2+ transport